MSKKLMKEIALRESMIRLFKGIYGADWGIYIGLWDYNRQLEAAKKSRSITETGWVFHEDMDRRHSLLMQ